MQNNLATWTTTDEEESAMNDDHAPLWRHMINLCINEPLTGKAVLDFGCNQGGFLEMLYKKSEYKEALGVDLAKDSLAFARQRLEGKPASFETPEILAQKSEYFDIAFSHEVLYLLPDIKGHAEIINKTLKPGGVYYAAIGCHTDQPIWEDWVSLIGSYSNVPVQSYSLDDYSNAFFDAGFTASVQPFRMDGFFPLKQNNPYFPKVKDSLRYYNEDKIIFRFEKTA